MLRCAPYQLSGGMKHRVAVARAWALTDAALLLMDEPFSAIDAINRMALQDYLVNTWMEEQRTVLYVTHDIEEAVYLADRIVILKPSPGRIGDASGQSFAPPVRAIVTPPTSSPSNRKSLRRCSAMASSPSSASASARLQQLIHRQGKVLAVMHPANCRVRADHGKDRVRGIVRRHQRRGGRLYWDGRCRHGLFDRMRADCRLDRWQRVAAGDHGRRHRSRRHHGGASRMIRECIHAGIAGVRIDDQPIEGKRRTQSAGLEVVPLEQAIVRYRAAVDAKNELDPSFVVMAQCYARDAANGGLDDALQRLAAYHREASVDWVQLESPHSADEIRAARQAVSCPLSFMKGRLPRYLTFEEHLALGVTIAWLPSFSHHVAWAALSDFMTDFADRGIAAWETFVESRKDRPYIIPEVPPDGEGLAKQRALEERAICRRPHWRNIADRMAANYS